VPVATLDPNAPLTAIVLTANAAATQTAANAPATATPTATPTRTPPPTPTATPTFLFIIVPPTLPPTLIPAGSSGREFECQVLAVDPPDNTEYFPTAVFTAKWTVANVGRSSWDSNNTDHRYSDGKRIFLQSVYDFPKSVPPGDTVDLFVDMQAPSDPGAYTTTWTISMGNNWFCPMNLTIVVK
jgi:hypothetical protein